MDARTWVRGFVEACASTEPVRPVVCAVRIDPVRLGPYATVGCVWLAPFVLKLEGMRVTPESLGCLVEIVQGTFMLTLQPVPAAIFGPVLLPSELRLLRRLRPVDLDPDGDLVCFPDQRLDGCTMKPNQPIALNIHNPGPASACFQAVLFFLRPDPLP